MLILKIIINYKGFRLDYDLFFKKIEYGGKSVKRYILILMVAIFTLLSACSSGKSEDQAGESASNGANNIEANEAEEVYSLENDGIDEEEFQEELAQFPKEKPDRIITTSVPITEMLQLLNITPVGVPTSTNPIPEEFADIDQIGSPMEPDLEVVTNLEPDLIIGAKSLEDSLESSLAGIELDRAYLKTDSFDDLKRTFKVLGTYFDKKEEMNTVLDGILHMENELMKQAEGKDLPSVLLVIGTSDSFMVMNENSYVGSLVEKLGAENIATTVLDAKDTYSPISMEEVVAADPDIIFVLASGDHGATEEMFHQEVESNEIWKSLSAYKEDEIYILEHEVFGVTSIKNVEKAMSQIADYFYK